MSSRKIHIRFEFQSLGENVVLIQLGDVINLETYRLIQAISKQLESETTPGLIEYVPSFCSVAVYYDPVYFEQNDTSSPYENVCKRLKQLIYSVKVEENESKRIVEIPVCYGGEYGPDLAEVAVHNGLTSQDVINIHSKGDYFVYMIGFAPGFPYVGGMSKKIATPRKNSPRMNVPAGSIGIAGNQTGIYPVETPGGWQIIGRTPIALFRPNESIPSYLKAGDHIRFIPISPTEYQSLEV